MTDPADATPGQRAVAALAAYVADAELTSEPGARDGEVVVTIPGERKLKTVASFLVRDELTSVSAFVIRNPDENHAEFYRFLLRRVMRRPLLGYAVDGSGDVYVRGQVPTVALDGRPATPHPEISWARARNRGPSPDIRYPAAARSSGSTAFRSLLSGSEDDPLYAVGTLPADPA